MISRWPVLALMAAAILIAPSCPMPSEPLTPLPVRAHSPFPEGSTLVYLADRPSPRNGSLTVVAMPSGRVVNRIDGRSAPSPRIARGSRFLFVGDLFNETGGGFRMDIYKIDLATGLRVWTKSAGLSDARGPIVAAPDGTRVLFARVTPGSPPQVRVTLYDGETGAVLAERGWPTTEHSELHATALADGRYALSESALGATRARLHFLGERLEALRTIDSSSGEIAPTGYAPGCHTDLRLVTDLGYVFVCPDGSGALVTVLDAADLSTGRWARIPTLPERETARDSSDARSLAMASHAALRGWAAANGEIGILTGWGELLVVRWTPDGVATSRHVVAPQDDELLFPVAHVFPDGGGMYVVLFELLEGRSTLIRVDVAPYVSRTLAGTGAVDLWADGDSLFLLTGDQHLLQLDRATGTLTGRATALPRPVSAISGTFR